MGTTVNLPGYYRSQLPTFKFTITSQSPAIPTYYQPTMSAVPTTSAPTPVSPNTRTATTTATATPDTAPRTTTPQTPQKTRPNNSSEHFDQLQDVRRALFT